MKMLLPAIAFSHGLSVLALWGLSVVSITRIFFGFPTGWGVALALYFAFYGGGGFKAMAFIQSEGQLKNPVGALCLMYSSALWFGVLFAFSGIPYSASALWALLLPLTFFGGLLSMAVWEPALDLINPQGKRT